MISELQKRINKLLNENPKTQDLSIEAIDNNGVMTLNGFAPSVEKSKIVQELVEAQAGVSAVINEIRVKEEEAESTAPKMIITPTDRNQPGVIIDPENEIGEDKDSPA
jgi:osmotically-inducible protein OsmY